MPTVHLVRGPRKDNPYRDRLLNLSIEALIEAFNREVGNPGWTSSRASYLAALHEALARLLEFHRGRFDEPRP